MSHQHRLPLSSPSGIISLRVRLRDAWVAAEVAAVGPLGVKVLLPSDRCPHGRDVVVALTLVGFEDQLLRLTTEVSTMRRADAGRTLLALRYGRISARGDRAAIVTFLTRVAGRLDLDEGVFEQTPDGWSYLLEELLAGDTRPLERAAAWATEHKDGQATVCSSTPDGLRVRLQTDMPLPPSLETVWLSICPRRAGEPRMRLRGTVIQVSAAASTFTVSLVPVGLAGHLGRWQAEVASHASRDVRHDVTVLEMPTQPIDR